jgi:DNA-directed RNA polymerase specialized sigma subunit
MSRRSTPEDFWKRVRRTGKAECWNWAGATNSTGYGNLMFNGRAVTAHRLAAFLSGIVSDVQAPKNRKGTGFILHSCDNRRCCNPAHMRVGTYTENQKEAYARKRRKAYKGITHTNAKQTKESLELIKDLYNHGVSQDAIAALLGVSQSGISKILLGVSYVETV